MDLARVGQIPRRGVVDADHMKLRQSARILKTKAVASVRASVIAFNGLDDDGRVTDVFLRMQHAFEMLMKAALNQGGVSVFDKKTGKSIGLERAINLAQGDGKIKLGADEAGLIRTIDAMRDEEQHWYSIVDEAILYMQIRAGVTLFDDLLFRVFEERLGNHIPQRVLPIGAEPPKDFQLLVDEEYERVRDLLMPGRRMGAQTRAHIRTLLAMEAHADPDTLVSDKDVTRVLKDMTEGKSRDQVFPKLSGVSATLSGEGVELEVRFVRSGGMPVTYVSDGADASAVRVVDLHKKYYLTASELATKLGVTPPRATAVRRHVGADTNPDMSNTFHMGKVRYLGYSDNAYTTMLAAVTKLDIREIWAAHRPTNRPLQSCTQPGCAAVSPTS
jgi:hypothetical protein